MSVQRRPSELLSIGAVAQRGGFSAPTIRYYESIGLLPRTERVSGRRRYDQSVLDRLDVVRLARAVGLTLDETRELLDGFPPRTPAATRWKRFADQKLAELDAQARRSGRMRSLLGHVPDCDCTDLTACVAAARECAEAEGLVPVMGERNALVGS